MGQDLITLTPENLQSRQLCCITRTKTKHPGMEAKRAWLAQRLEEGHVFRKLDEEKACAFIEYAPLESAWTPVVGENFLYIYCLWVQGAAKGCGHGKRLMESCIEDARAHDRSGVCMLGAKKQKGWLSDQSFAKRFGFQCVDTAGEYELLCLSFGGSLPQFAPCAKRQTIESRNLTVYYDDQCPFIPPRIAALQSYCAEREIPAEFIHVQTLEQAKHLPCVFNNWAIFYNGTFRTVNQLDGAGMEKLIKKG